MVRCKAVLAALCGLSLLLGGCAGLALQRPGLEAAVRAEVMRQGIPGAALAVLVRGQPLHVQGYGQANLEHAVPVTPQTVFQTGSLAKQFTAVAVMLQVEDGRLALDEPLTRHFPDAPAFWAQVTVRQLLNHTAGIPNFADGQVDPQRPHSEAELLALAYRLPAAFAPGERWLYSDTGYVLLGLLVGRVAGRHYGEELRERVFAPLGMASARVISEAAVVSHRAAGYQRVGGQLQNQDWVHPSLNTTADGSLYLSLQDWVAWLRALRERRVLSAASWQAVFSPARLKGGEPVPHGFGLELPAPGGPRRIGHAGAWQGFTAQMSVDLDADIAVVALSNLAGAQPQRLVDIAFAHFGAAPKGLALHRNDTD